MAGFGRVVAAACSQNLRGVHHLCKMHRALQTSERRPKSPVVHRTDISGRVGVEALYMGDTHRSMLSSTFELEPDLDIRTALKNLLECT